MIKIHTKKWRKATCFLSLMNFYQTRRKFKDFILKTQSAFETKNALKFKSKIHHRRCDKGFLLKTQNAF